MQSSWTNIERLPGKGATRTLDDVAQLMAMTRQQVMAIEATALRKLRNRLGPELHLLFREAMQRDAMRSDAAAGAVQVKSYDEENRL
jgi:hypothetical protein